MADKQLSAFEQRIYNKGVEYGVNNATKLHCISILEMSKTMLWFSLFVLAVPLWILPMSGMGLYMLYENQKMKKNERLNEEDPNYYCWKCEARGFKHKHNYLGQIID